MRLTTDGPRLMAHDGRPTTDGLTTDSLTTDGMTPAPVTACPLDSRKVRRVGVR